MICGILVDIILGIVLAISYYKNKKWLLLYIIVYFIGVYLLMNLDRIGDVRIWKIFL